MIERLELMNSIHNFTKKLTMIHDAPMSCYIKLFNDIDDLCLVLL